MLNKSKHLIKIPLFEYFLLFIVKCPVQMSGSGVRLIFQTMFGSVQLKNLGLKSLTIYDIVEENLL